MEKYLDEMQACVIQETGISNQAQAKIQRNSILRDYAKKMCDAFEQEYSDATSGRYVFFIFKAAFGKGVAYVFIF